MPKFRFTVVQHGSRSEPISLELADQAAAWEEATRAAGEMVRDMDGQLKLGSEWQLEVADGKEQAIFSLIVQAKKGAA